MERDAKSALKDAVVAGLLNAENSFTISRKELGKTLINAASSITEAEAESYFDNTIEAKYTAEPLKTTMTKNTSHYGELQVKRQNLTMMFAE